MSGLIRAQPEIGGRDSVLNVQGVLHRIGFGQFLSRQSVQCGGVINRTNCLHAHKRTRIIQKGNQISVRTTAKGKHGNQPFLHRFGLGTGKDLFHRGQAVKGGEIGMTENHIKLTSGIAGNRLENGPDHLLIPLGSNTAQGNRSQGGNPWRRILK